jgi:hypothetical protein
MWRDRFAPNLVDLAFIQSAPLHGWFVGAVRAGLPSPAEHVGARRLDLTAQLTEHPQATFHLKARGNSMLDVRIFGPSSLEPGSAFSLKQNMTTAIKNSIVRRALELEQRHPDWSSLQVLDVAMDGHVHTHPDFGADGSQEFADWLNPPSPFARLLKGAFGSHLAAEDFDPLADCWHEVINAFGARYRLWQ